MTFLADTHCHLYMHDFDTDRIDVINNAWKKGIRKILIPGIDLNSSSESVELCFQFDSFLYSAAGIHPNQSRNFSISEIKNLEALFDDPHIIAVGEIGLDFYRDTSPENIQVLVFKEMLEISKKMNKPVCIHNRNADEKIIEILENWYSELIKIKSSLVDHPGVFHSYNGSEIIARWAHKHNFYLGISGPVTFSKTNALQKIIRDIDINNIIIETDAPFLSPHPLRGKRNQPEYVRYIAEKIADLKSIKINDVIKLTSKNANDLFNWE